MSSYQQRLGSERRRRNHPGQQRDSLILNEDDRFRGGLAEFERPTSESTIQPERKRKRTTTATASLGVNLPSPGPSSQDTSQHEVNQLEVKIKSEAEEQAVAELQLKSSTQRVKIYVGSNNTIYEIGLNDLAKSPALQAQLRVRKSGDSPDVMHPVLTQIPVHHFQAVREFLLTDEYMPAILDNRAGEDALPKRLDGCETADDYHTELLRAGHLYVVADRLRIQSMKDLIRLKIVTAQYHTYSMERLLDLAMIIFSRPEGIEDLTRIRGEADGQEDKDALEEWLVEALGSRFVEVMSDHGKQFVEVMVQGACAARNFGPRVFSWKVQYWNSAGPNATVIEDY
jgi:hypothetical protein